VDENTEVRCEVRTVDAHYSIAYAQKFGDRWQLRHRIPRTQPNGHTLFLWTTDIVHAHRIISMREVSDD
jgi:hypothetical protein